MDGGLDPVNAFDTAVLRAQETGLGIMVYSLVAVLIWPSSSRADFHAAAANLASTQHQLFTVYLQLMLGQGGVEKAQPLRAQELQVETRFGQLLDAAVAEDYETWELRRQWRRYQRLAADLTETMELWRESFAEVEDLDLPQLLPGLEAFGIEIEQRLAQIDRMLAGDALQSAPQALDLAFDRDAINRLSHFHQAAVAVTRSRLQRLEQMTLSLFEVVCDIKGIRRSSGLDRRGKYPVDLVSAGSRSPGERRPPVGDHVVGLSCDDLCARHARWGRFVSMAGSLGIALATMPQVPISMLIAAMLSVSVLFAGVLYIFVMPQLSSFTGLGLMIFAVTFGICYLFAAPRQGLGRAFGLAMFVTITSISNQQTYNFLTVADTAMMFPLMFPDLRNQPPISLFPRVPRPTFCACSAASSAVPST